MTHQAHLKQTLRAEMKRARKHLSEIDRDLCNRSIQRQLFEDPVFQQAPNIMAFVSMGSEVDTRPILQRILENGKKLLLPRCVAGTPIFDPVAVRDLDKDLVAGPMRGLRDPKPGLPIYPEEQPIHLVLVPGLAFDKRRSRLGYGKGMYDRFLARYKTQHTIGLAFDLQRVDTLPEDPFDIPMQRVLTEKGWF